MTKKCESCFGIEENVGTEEFIQCAHESYKSNDSAMHKIGIRFADVDATIDILDNHMSQAEDNIATLQDQTGQLEKDIVGINTELDSLGKRFLAQSFKHLHISGKAFAHLVQPF